MKKLLAVLFIFGALTIGSQAHASVLSDALLQIKNLKNEVLLLKSKLKASVLDSSLSSTPTTDLTPRISMWTGKVNQHVDIDSSTWQTDADGSSGADVDKLEYCKKFYPNTTSVTEYKNETINSWHAGGNSGNYASTKMSYECVQEIINPSITILSPNGGEDFQTESAITIKTLSNNIQGDSSIAFNLQSKYDNKLYYLGSGSPLESEFKFMLPQGLILGQVGSVKNNFKILARVTGPNGVGQDSSDDTFTISLSSIAVTYPVGGEIFKAGDKINVKWTSHNVNAKYIGIMLSNNNDKSPNTTVITDSTLNDGNETITLPASYGDHIQINITNDQSGGAFSDEFSIVPNVTITNTTTTDSTPRISYWQGKVNQHVIAGDTVHVWETDPDGVSGAGLDKLTYCKKFYPNTTSVTEYKNETINSWHAGGNSGNYASTKMSYKCVQGNTAGPSITVLSPKGGETWYFGNTYEIKWEVKNFTEPVMVALISPIGTNGNIWCTLGTNIPVSSGRFVFNLKKDFQCKGSTSFIEAGVYQVNIYNGLYPFDILRTGSITISDTKTCPVGCTCDSNGDTINCPVVGSYATWTEKTINNFDINTINTGIISSPDGKNIIAVGDYSRYLYKSKDGGLTWTNQTDVGAYNNTGRVFTYPDGSKVGWEIRGWYSISSSSDMKKIALLGHAGTGTVPYGTNTYLYTSLDGGDTWVEHSTPEGTHFYKITSSSDGSKLVSADYNGYIYTSIDNGATWIKQINSGQQNWSSLASSSDGSILFATNRGTGYFDGSIYRSTNSGVTWVKLNTPSLMSWNGVATSSDGKKVVAVGSCKDYNNCHIYTSVDSGNTWTAQNNSFSGNSQYYNFVTSSSDGTKLAATGSTNIYLSRDSGVTWTAQKGIDLIFNSVNLLGDGSKMVAGNFNGRIFVGELNSTSISTTTPSSVKQSSGGISNNGTITSTESSINRTLKIGMKGDDVVILQTFLEITADGSFGSKTKAKVMEWQALNGITADGSFGPMSREKAGL